MYVSSALNQIERICVEFRTGRHSEDDAFRSILSITMDTLRHKLKG